DQGAHRGGRGVLRRPARVPAPQGGVHHRGGRHRAGRPGGVRPQRRRHRAARPHAARHERHRRVQGPAHPLRRPGDHGDRAGQRDRQGRGPGAGRRRLRHQAVLGAGADRAHPGRAAPRRRGRPGAGRPARRAGGRAGADGRRAPRGQRRRPRGAPAAQGVRPAGVPPAQRRSRAHPRPAHRPRLGRRLRRRHEDPRRARQTPAQQGRDGPQRAPAPGDRAGAGLQVREL
ncbi:MAG: Phosphate regulon transcriptional regulatory protein PhoB (SphR), partial [uncultured Pseudonocardia sp.]